MTTMHSTPHHCTRRAGLARLLLTALAPAALLAGCDRVEQTLQAQQKFRGQNVAGAAAGKDFSLLDSTGQRRTLADFRGQAVMMFFGFTQCPDVCPTALARMAEVRHLLGPERAKRLQVLFVSVDPERDTPEILTAYMNAFDAGFIALRPTEEELRKIASDFKVLYRRVPTGSSYTMDHSAQAFVFDPQGRLRLTLRHEQSAQDYAHDIQLLLQEAGA